MVPVSKPRLLTLRGSLLATLLFVGATGRIDGQMGPFLSPSQVPQAQTEEEYDGYLDILTSKDPRQTVRRVNRFAREFPKSQMLGLAFEHEMLAYKSLQDWPEVVRSGERALHLEPRNVTTLLTVAAAMISGVQGRALPPSLLDKSEQYAGRVIQELHTMNIPRQIPLDKWEAMRGNLEGQAHDLLGQVAVLQGNTRAARREFEAAIDSNPNPQGSQFLRLGLLCESLGEDDQASRALRRAVELGPGAVRALAMRELQEIQRRPARRAATHDARTANAGSPK